ncbi:MAG: cytochrome c-type biogenesis protein CcmH [Gammaproteobacteria bacterium]|nr:cytochrome c-type biogenesis protein CcmH [Gammaproteobacteria bacterium]
MSKFPAFASLMLGLFMTVHSFALDAPKEFADPEQERLYGQVIRELRCLVCQNQNLADSNADLAQDLRRKSYEMIVSGKGYDEIIHFMVQRYGDFVLYRPRLKPATLILWFAPFAMLVLLVTVVVARTRSQKARHPVPLSHSEKLRVDKLLK